MEVGGCGNLASQNEIGLANQMVIQHTYLFKSNYLLGKLIVKHIGQIRITGRMI
jgi:hypothetical protein